MVVDRGWWEEKIGSSVGIEVWRSVAQREKLHTPELYSQKQ